MQLRGTDSLSLAMNSSGKQKPPGQAARKPCSPGGTSVDGMQRAPPHAGEQSGKLAGEKTGGPVHGHVSTVGG
jgi:hypothetical protein